MRTLCALVPSLLLMVLPAAGLAAEAGSVANRALSSGELLGWLEHRAGIALDLGCGEARFTRRLAARSRLLLHGLDPDEASVVRGRVAVQAQGQAGQVTLLTLPGASLPYPDHTVNVVLVENPGPVSRAEVTRVLVPGGVAWWRDGEAWRPERKAWPSEFDEWTHGRHGADGNMVSQDLAVGLPEGVRWVAGPAQDSGGKKWYYDHVLVSAQGRNFYLTEEGLTARDAFNGTRLWSRPMKASTFTEVGTDLPEPLLGLVKVGARTCKVRPVAAGGSLFAAADGELIALEAATGEVTARFAKLDRPRKLLVSANRLVVSETNRVRAFDLASNEPVWSLPINAERIVAGDGQLFCLAGAELLGCDLATGRIRWRVTEVDAEPATTCTYHQGFLVLEKSSWRDDPFGCGILVYSGDDGRRLWTKDYRPNQTHYQEARAFFAQGLLWLQLQGGKVAGLDPRTGRQVRIWTTRGHHCAAPVATERYFLAPECDFTDLATGARTQTRFFKNACRLPFIPANGLLYSFPVQCECYPMLRGYMGLRDDPLPAADDSPGFVKGPAWGRPLDADVAATAGDWPMYRRDVFRSGRAPERLTSNALKVAWKRTVAPPPPEKFAEEWGFNPFSQGRLTPPVAAGSRVLTASPDEHRIVALDLDTGEPAWSFTAAGRVDTPPSVFEDLCLFGSHDGWVYCLHNRDGRLVWKLRAAPQDCWIPAYGQLESVWPVPGSVLVDDGIAVFASGRHPYADGGVQVFAVKARTGEVVWKKTIQDLTLKGWYGWEVVAKRKVGLDFEPVDLLVRDGDRWAMSRWQFNRGDGDVQLDLASFEYRAGGLAVPRGLWSYGIRQKKILENKPPTVFDSVSLHAGQKGDTALLLAGDELVRATAAGELWIGRSKQNLGGVAVHDGLALARGRLLAATEEGDVICLE